MLASITFIIQNIKNKRWLVLGYLTLLLESITPIIAIMLQEDIIDNVFVHGIYEDFYKLLILYVVFQFAPKLFFTFRKVSFFHLSYQVQRDLTDKFLEKIYRLPSQIFDKEHTGKLLNNIRNDISDASDVAINQIMSESVYIISVIVFLCISLITVNTKIVLGVLPIILVYAVMLKILGGKTKLLAENIRTEKGHVAVTVEESVSSIKETVAFNRNEWQLNRYEVSFKSYFKAILKQSLYKIKIVFIREPFMYGGKIIALLVGGLAAIRNEISIGEFVVIFSLLDLLITALGQFFDMNLTAVRLIAPVDKIKQVLNYEEDEFGTETLNKIDSIEFHNVTFSYTDEDGPVLRNLSLQIPVGKKVAFVGESGSGKSTIAKLLLRTHYAQVGSVLINDIDVKAYNKSYTDTVSVVSQEPHFIPTSVRENLTFGKNYDDVHLMRVCKEMVCLDFIQQLDNGFDTIVGERGSGLSGGQKQRLALSRTLLKDTDILLLDEATSALDMETESIVQKNIDKMRAGKTTIIIAHRLSSIQNADLIYVLDKGKIVSKGSHNQLISECKIYQKLYLGEKVS